MFELSFKNSKSYTTHKLAILKADRIMKLTRDEFGPNSDLNYFVAYDDGEFCPVFFGTQINYIINTDFRRIQLPK